MKYSLDVIPCDQPAYYLSYIKTPYGTVRLDNWVKTGWIDPKNEGAYLARLFDFVPMLAYARFWSTQEVTFNRHEKVVIGNKAFRDQVSISGDLDTDNVVKIADRQYGILDAQVRDGRQYVTFDRPLDIAIRDGEEVQVGRSDPSRPFSARVITPRPMGYSIFGGTESIHQLRGLNYRLTKCESMSTTDHYVDMLIGVLV